MADAQTPPPAPRIETDRLVLRWPRPVDAAAVLEVHRHKPVSDGVLSIPHPCPDDHGEAWIASLDGKRADNLYIWLIERRDSGAVVGDCGILIEPKHRRGTIGYLLHPDHWGRGFATEAVTGMIRHTFTDLDPPLERIEADVFPSNAASARVCQRLGMTREGTLRGYLRKDGEQRDVVRWSILRNEPCR